MNVLILAAGNSATTNADGYPLCLSEVMGKPLIQVMLEKWQGLEVPVQHHFPAGAGFHGGKALLELGVGEPMGDDGFQI